MFRAVAEKRYVVDERMCREALEIKCNHAQLYLNLAEVYRQEGRDGGDKDASKGIHLHRLRFTNSQGT